MEEKVVAEVEYLLMHSEDEIWKRTKDVLLQLYWDIGWVLRDVSLSNLWDVSKLLEQRLEVDAKTFEVAYHFYRENPILQKAVRPAK
tara:strand:- start:490 stop:750 length:261 start_codon:yes stop_codon:yes gene_type:complete